MKFGSWCDSKIFNKIDWAVGQPDKLALTKELAKKLHNLAVQTQMFKHDINVPGLEQLSEDQKEIIGIKIHKSERRRIFEALKMRRERALEKNVGPLQRRGRNAIQKGRMYPEAHNRRLRLVGILGVLELILICIASFYTSEACQNEFMRE